jgi:hypothetical protein
VDELGDPGAVSTVERVEALGDLVAPCELALHPGDLPPRPVVAVVVHPAQLAPDDPLGAVVIALEAVDRHLPRSVRVMVVEPDALEAE